MIRHGETSWNKAKKLQGRKDIMLDADGIRLAELTGEGMKDIDFDFAISSPLMRATDCGACTCGTGDTDDHGQENYRDVFWKVGR